MSGYGLRPRLLSRASKRSLPLGPRGQGLLQKLLHLVQPRTQALRHRPVDPRRCPLRARPADPRATGCNPRGRLSGTPRTLQPTSGTSTPPTSRLDQPPRTDGPRDFPNSLDPSVSKSLTGSVVPAGTGVVPSDAVMSPTLSKRLPGVGEPAGPGRLASALCGQRVARIEPRAYEAEGRCPGLGSAGSLDRGGGDRARDPTSCERLIAEVRACPRPGGGSSR